MVSTLTRIILKDTVCEKFVQIAEDIHVAIAIKGHNHWVDILSLKAR